MKKAQAKGGSVAGVRGAALGRTTAHGHLKLMPQHGPPHAMYDTGFRALSVASRAECWAGGTAKVKWGG